MAPNGSTNQSDEILATSREFVPTALCDSAADSATAEPVDWQTAMKRAIRDSGELRRRLGLPAEPPVSAGPQARDGSGDRSHPPRLDPSQVLEGETQFPTFVPLEYLGRIGFGDPDDPLLRQVMPVAAEAVTHPGETSDPVGDLAAMVAPGLLHKYHGRALLIVSGACGVHCRYCFRREFPYHVDSGPIDQWRGAIDYLNRHQDIEEVLLSGGDPLTVTDASLARLVDRLESVSHIRRLRIHTRLPIVIPQRITSELVERLASSRLAVWFVVHVNHPRELDQHVLNALTRLIDRGIPVLNQAVLLRGVNDDATTLMELCRRLVDHRIQPYYLHQLDRVRGTSHFAVSEEAGRQLIKHLREHLPGYAVPDWVTEQPGEPSKTLVV
jgi:EF-P beta-lysylation protein EpmB